MQLIIGNNNENFFEYPGLQLAQLGFDIFNCHGQSSFLFFDDRQLFYISGRHLLQLVVLKKRKSTSMRKRNDDYCNNEFAI